MGVRAIVSGSLLIVAGRQLCFVSPARPAITRLVGKQLNLRQLGIHLLNERVGFIGLATMFAARRLNYRGRAFSRKRARNFTSRRHNQQFVLIPDKVAETNLVLHPYDIRLVLKAPCDKHIERFPKMRDRCPHKHREWRDLGLADRRSHQATSWDSGSRPRARCRSGCHRV